ncbi:MAG: lysylphosphatidylglycerol synthase transmembrane domain-containing protein [Thermodesulfobacteriota bacterium]
MNKKIILSLLFGGILSIITLYFAFRNVPFAALIDYLGSINFIWIIPSVLFVLIGFMGRALRWQVILQSSHQIRYWRAFHPMMIGFMLNCILPARIGELARPAVLLKKDHVPYTTGLATVATERVFDLLIMITLFTIVFLNVRIDPNLEIPFGAYKLNKDTLESIGSGMIKLLLVLIAGIVIISIDRVKTGIIRIISRLPDLFFVAGPGAQQMISRFIALPLVRVVENVAAGFVLVKDGRRMLLCILLSSIIWVINATSYYLMALGCPDLGLSPLEITAVMLIICFFIALPSVPGFWGLWEAGGVFALSLFSIPAKDAAGFALASHAVQMFPVIFIGMVSALVYGINIRAIQVQPVSNGAMDP